MPFIKSRQNNDEPINIYYEDFGKALHPMQVELRQENLMTLLLRHLVLLMHLKKNLPRQVLVGLVADGHG